VFDKGLELVEFSEAFECDGFVFGSVFHGIVGDNFDESKFF